MATNPTIDLASSLFRRRASADRAAGISERSAWRRWPSCRIEITVIRAGAQGDADSPSSTIHLDIASSFVTREHCPCPPGPCCTLFAPFIHPTQRHDEVRGALPPLAAPRGPCHRRAATRPPQAGRAAQVALLWPRAGARDVRVRSSGRAGCVRVKRGARRPAGGGRIHRQQGGRCRGRELLRPA